MGCHLSPCRYARAVFAAAQRVDALEAVGEDLTVLATLAESRPEFRYFLLTPRIRKERKEEVLRTLFREQVQQVTLQFLFVLLDKRRQQLLRLIAGAFRALLDVHYRRQEVTVASARPLDETQQDALVSVLGRMTGMEIRLQQQVQPAVLGGLVVSVGHTVYDGSLRTQLTTLQTHLLQV